MMCLRWMRSCGSRRPPALAARRTGLRFSQRPPLRIVLLSSLLPAVPDCKRMKLTVTLSGADGG
jgi:hypothetical protein